MSIEDCLAHSAVTMIAEKCNPKLFMRQKLDTLFRLAYRAEGGCIVELGACQGWGTMALAMGTRAGNKLRVYAVDDYEERHGWVGEPYGPENRDIFLQNTKGLRVELIEADVGELVRAWNEPIALLHWDLGVTGRLKKDFDAWWPHCQVFAAHGSGGEQALGTKELPGAERMKGIIWTVRR